MHKLLERQIKEHLEGFDQPSIDKLQPLFAVINEAYETADKDRVLTERSVDISSREMADKNHQLELEVEANRDAIHSLKQTLSTLEPKVFDPSDAYKQDEAKELVRLANYLRSMVITNRRALEEVERQEENAEELSRQLARFKIAVDSAADYITMLDASMNIVYANPSVKQRTGYTSAEGKPIGMQWWSHVDESEILNMQDLMVNSAEDDQHSFELTGNTSDGEEFLMAVHMTTIRDDKGAVQLILDISRDVSKERSLEKLKDEFVSIASHELRTPMTVIRGYSRILQSEKAGPLSDKQKDYLQRISTNTQMLIELVGDMLNLGKLEANKLTFDIGQHRLRSIVDAAAEKFKDMYDEKRLNLQVDVDEGDVSVDMDRMDQVFTNLLSNAFKFTPAGGTIGIFSQPYLTDPNMVMVAIEDTGIGIPHDARDALFKKFSQVDNVLQRQAGGTGLGLAICKEIIEKMGGKIWVEDRRTGPGTRFCFTLPKLPMPDVGYNQENAKQGEQDAGQSA